MGFASLRVLFKYTRPTFEYKLARSMTFSIVARNGKSIGAGVASGSIAVGSRVPWVKSRVGAVVTQGYTEIRCGMEGLRLLEAGLNPKAVIQRILHEDPAEQMRQVAIIDCFGRKAVHTGSECPSERGSIVQSDFVCVGNMLEDEEVVLRMAEAFEEEKELARGILKALSAGSKAGGDRRGERSSALAIRGKEEVDVGVDWSLHPIEVLRKKYEGYEP